MFFKNNLISYLQISLFFLPISLIAGSLVININIIIFLILSTIYIFSNKLTIRFGSTNLSLFIFFLIIIFSSFLNIKIIGLENFTKSILLIKFFLLFIFLDTLISNNKIDLKIFFKICLFSFLFVSIDVIFQFTFGKNLLGFYPHEGRITGMFGSEAIAGAYIQKFFLFSLIGVYLITYLKNYKFNIYEIIFFGITLFSSFVASNRMSFFILFALFFFLMIISKVFRKNLIFTLMLTIPFLYFLFQNNSSINERYGKFLVKAQILLINFKDSFSQESKMIFKDSTEKKEIDIPSPPSSRMIDHSKIYLTTFESFKDKKFFGNGYKSFRYKCSSLSKKNENFTCSSHPHNYHLEVLHDTGVIGFLTLSFFVFSLIFKSLNKLRKSKINYNDKIIFALIMMNLLIELFPLKSTGSLFTTWNGTSVWLAVALTNYRNNEI